MFIKDWKNDYGSSQTTCTRCGGSNFISLCKNCGDLEAHDEKIKQEIFEQIKALPYPNNNSEERRLSDITSIFTKGVE